VCDFGLARALDDEGRLTRTGQLLGTPAYMAPEQTDGGAARPDPRTDVYALGAALYEALTGEPPFRGETALKTVTAVLTRPPRAPSELRPGLDPELERICLRCLAKDPAGRFPSAHALALALLALEHAGPRKASRRARRAGPPAPERPRAAPWVVGGLAAAGALTAGVWIGRSGPAGEVVRPAPAGSGPGQATAPPDAAAAADGDAVLADGPPADGPPADATPADAPAEVPPAGGSPGASVPADAKARAAQAFDLAEELRARADRANALGDIAQGDVLKRRAIERYNDALAQDPRHARALHYRGLCRANLEDWAGAIRDYEAALAIDDAYWQTYFNRACAQARFPDRHTEVVAGMTRAIELKARDGGEPLGTAYLFRGLSRAALGALDEAAADLRRAAEIYDRKGEPRRAEDARRCLAQLEASRREAR